MKLKKSKSLVAFLLVFVLFASISGSALAASETIGNNTWSDSRYDVDYFGQSFTPTKDITVSSAYFYMQSGGSSTRTVRVAIRAAMNGANLAQSTNTSVNKGWAWRNFTFSTPVKLDAGTTYYLVVTYSSGDLDYALSSGNSYAGGTRLYWNGSYSAVSGDAVFSISNVVTKYPVTFYDWDGVTVLGTPQMVDYGAGAVAEPDPVRDGYTFIGWDVAFDHITGELDVTAQYEAIAYDITYNLDGGTNYDGAPTSYTPDSSEIVFGEPTKAEYSFGGWYDNCEFTGEPVTTVPTGSIGDIELWAKWTINSYTVRFLDFDGALIATQYVDSGDGAVAPADPVRDGYTFDGWDVEFDNITDDLDVTAKYTKNAVIEEEEIPFTGSDALCVYDLLISALAGSGLFYGMKRKKSTHQ